MKTAARFYQHVEISQICIDLNGITGIASRLAADVARSTGDRYRRGCKAGYTQVAGDAEVRCAEEGIWKVGNRNALQIECAHVEEYCPV